MAEKKTYTRTISAELLKEWQKQRRKGDTEKLMKETQLSRPIIDRALIHGSVASEGLTEKITAYFVARLTGEREQAKILGELAKPPRPAPAIAALPVKE